MKKLALVLSVLLGMCGCHSSVTAPVVVGIAPTTPPSIDQGQSLQFTATTAYDSSNQGVAWSASGPGCSGAACGTFSNVTRTSATYNAPPVVSANMPVTVTATSVASPTQYASANFTVVPPPSVVTTNLPIATPNYVYLTTLQGAGGVQPLKWSLAGGTLPAGLALNSAGLISGTPTAGGTSTFTVKLTDSSGAASGGMSVQQTFSLTVVAVLSVPTTTLPEGTIGVAYNGTLPVSGGMFPYNWTLYSGSLPTGLMLQSNTGVISGTPTVAGTSSFSIEAFDSSPVQQSYISSNFFITITASGHLSIRTSSLLDGTVGTPYTGQLVATGGTTPYAWTITTGALPSGLTLNGTTGAISGTPTAAPGAFPFTVSVSDASSPQQTSTQALSLTLNATVPTCSSTGNNSVLAGQYAFSLRGFNGNGFLAVVGSFTADGSGNITAGEADTNGVLGPATGRLISAASSYSVGSDNRGCATLATPFGTFYTRFAVGDLSAGVATQGRIIEFDNPGATAYVAAGQLLQQTSSAFLFSLTGTYAWQTAGWDFSSSSRVACVGLLRAANYQFSSQEQDCNDGGALTNTSNTNTTFTNGLNTFSTPDASGRVTGTLSVGENTSGLTLYWVSSSYLLTVNSESSPTLSGALLLEQVPLATSGFSQASLNTTVAAYSSGLAPSGAGAEVSVAVESANGASALTSQLYQDVAGALQTSSTSCTYAVVLIGRGTLGSSCGTTLSLFYLTSLNNAYVLGTDTTASLGTFEPQTSGLTIGNLAGTYYVGTWEVVSQSAQAEVAVLTVSNAGVVTSTTDSASILSQTAGTAGSDTWTLNSNGTISTASSGKATLGIAISGSKFAIIGNPALTYPTLLIGQQ